VAYGCAFFRSALLGHGTHAYLSGHLLPAAVSTGDTHLSFEWRDVVSTVDHHENSGGIVTNSLGRPTSQHLSLNADEYKFAQSGGGTFNDTFYGDTTGMVATTERSGGYFRTELDGKSDLRDQEIWIRTAEVYDGNNVPAGHTGFELALEDGSGLVAWVDSDEVGGLPRPYDRRADDLATWGADFTKSMLKTLRFRANCFIGPNAEFNLKQIVAIRLRLDRDDKRDFAFDVLQIVKQ
jgi:hypothetical protein